MGQKDFLINRIVEAAALSSGGNIAVYMDFYDTTVQLSTEREIARFVGSDCAFFGGTEYCERKMLAIFPSGAEPDYRDYPIEVIYIERLPEGLDHRDVLGSLMGAGIEREKVGDINVFDGHAQIFVAKPMGDFLESNLERIGAFEVSAKKIPLSDAVVIAPKFAELDIIVPSMRLDAIIHAVYKLSRSEAAAFVKAERVQINHVTAQKPAANLRVGDIVSVRTKGRFVVGSELGATKKGNLRLRISKYV